jgi:hypothetical protein
VFKWLSLLVETITNDEADFHQQTTNLFDFGQQGNTIRFLEQSTTIHNTPPPPIFYHTRHLSKQSATSLLAAATGKFKNKKRTETQYCYLLMSQAGPP